MDNQQPSRIKEYVWKYAEGSTTKYSRKPSESVRSSSIKEDEDIVSTSSES